MKITETIERECCQSKDLKPMAGVYQRIIGMGPTWKFCVHCGRAHALRKDQDGDHVYVGQPWPWEANVKG